MKEADAIQDAMHLLRAGATIETILLIVFRMGRVCGMLEMANAIKPEENQHDPIKPVGNS